jgi:DNA repair photolyase
MRVPLPIRGHGASWNPPNRFETIHLEPDDWVDPDDPDPARPGTQILRDSTREILSQNDSPDLSFEHGINVYRGCSHACTYCFARPYHEYLGFSAGLDFETKIVVKENAPELLRKRLSHPKWKPQTIMMSGATDPYQPLERRMKLTRGVLEVLAEFRNPVAVITKNHLITRDVDLLVELARHDAVSCILSVTTLRNELQRIMEPRTSIPRRRLDAIRTLAAAGVPVGVNVAPVIPGLTDEEMPAILEAAADAGAKFAHFVLVRLPHAVAPIFETWLAQHFPDRKEKVLNRLRDLHGGKLYDSAWGHRGRGAGAYAEQIAQVFRITSQKAGLNRDSDKRALSTASFRVPGSVEQLALL